MISSSPHPISRRWVDHRSFRSPWTSSNLDLAEIKLNHIRVSLVEFAKSDIELHLVTILSLLLGGGAYQDILLCILILCISIYIFYRWILNMYNIYNYWIRLITVYFSVISDLQADLLIPPLANTINTCAATPTFRAACTSFAGTSAIQKVHRALMHREWSWNHSRLKWNKVDSTKLLNTQVDFRLTSFRQVVFSIFFCCRGCTTGTRRRCDASAATRGVISRRRGIQIMEVR